MKNFICTSILAILIASVTTVTAQDYPEEYLGLPGDNLNLYAVMKLFQESETLEAFERNLNAEDSRINNLDLNGDNMVDYLTVADYVDGNGHTIVLRSVLDRNEYQDVAVFTVEKFRDGSVQIQLIGDQALYGKNYIVEPIYAETPNPGYRGTAVSRNNVSVVTTTYHEVAAWPMISFIYSPRYTVWRSSWYWGYYPVYWRPWRPFYWHYYYGYHSHWYPDYYAHYRHWDRPRYHRYNTFYYGSVRAHSAKVEHRITEGNYRQTYSKPDTRKDGEALYVKTHGTRSSVTSRPAASGTSRRDTPVTSSRSSSATRTSAGQPAASDNSRRSTTVTSSRSSSTTRPSASQGGETTRRSTSTTAKSTPATTGRSSVSTSSSRQSSPQKTQSTVRRSTQSSAGSSQPATSKSQSTAQRSQSTATRSQSATQKSSPSVSQRSSAPAARSQSTRSSKSSSSAAPSRSSKSSSAASSRRSSSSKSTSTKSSSSKSSSSKSSKSSKNSENGKSSSRR